MKQTNQLMFFFILHSSICYLVNYIMCVFSFAVELGGKVIQEALGSFLV